MYSFPSLSPPPHCLAACIPCSQLTAWKDCQFDAISCSWIQCSQEHYYGNLISWEIDQIPLTEWNTNVLYGFLGKACVGSTIIYIIYRVVIKKKNYCLISTILFLKIIHLKQLTLNSSIKTKKNPLFSIQVRVRFLLFPFSSAGTFQKWTLLPDFCTAVIIRARILQQVSENEGFSQAGTHLWDMTVFNSSQDRRSSAITSHWDNTLN